MIDAGRYLYREPRLGLTPPVPAATFARMRDNVAFSMTLVARRLGDDLTQGRLSNAAHRSVAATAIARRDERSRSRSRTAADLALC